jgi:ribonuclease BN (tRNA processing enzyme)
VKIQLLPSTFDGAGRATPEQRLTCFLIDDRVTVDAGSLALALTDEQRESVRDIIITHPHMDHIASLPIFIDDLFGSLTEPIRVHATDEVIGMLERDIFNWTVYPRFAELKNEHGPVMQYVPFKHGEEFEVAHLKVTAVPVNHIVPTVGLVVSDSKTTVAFSSDTYQTEEFWQLVNRTKQVDALLIEASFPNDMAQLAEVSRHFTPATMAEELRKLNHNGLDILTVHLKPAYRARLVEELNALQIPRLRVMEPGHIYEW